MLHKYDKRTRNFSETFSLIFHLSFLYLEAFNKTMISLPNDGYEMVRAG